jgi:GNAT superfamily N-acetyltransferase
MRIASCRIEQIEPGDDISLARMAELYVEAFPPGERKPVAFLGKALERDDYRLIGLVCDERLEGLAVLYEPHCAEFRLLEYMAITPARRNQGFGSFLFDSIMAQQPTRTLLLEVESETGDGREAGTSRRRREFYLRLGCRPVPGIDYAMPAVASVKPPPMTLFACGAKTAGIDPVSLPRWLKDIYDKVYETELTDERLSAMLGRKDEASR